MRDRWKVTVLVGLTAALVFGPSAFALSPYDILVVNDGHTLGQGQSAPQGSSLDSEMASRYIEGLEQVDEVRIDYYNTTPNQFGPGVDEMREYDMVLWYTLGDFRNYQACPNNQLCQTLLDGDKDGNLNPPPSTVGGDIENITTYLQDHNGRILLTGSQLSFEVGGSNFADNVIYSEVPLEVQLCDPSDFECGGAVSLSNIREYLESGNDDPVFTDDPFFLNTNLIPEQRYVVYGKQSGNSPGNVEENLNWPEDQGENRILGLDTDSDGFRDRLATAMVRGSMEDHKFLNVAFDLATISDTHEPRRNELIRRSVNYLLGPRADGSTIREKPINATIGEAGIVREDSGVWHNISFTDRYTDPVVIGSPNSRIGGDGPIIQVRNVRPTWAEIRVCQSRGSTGSGCQATGEEDIGYLVVDTAKTQDVPGIQAGRFEVGGSFGAEDRRTVDLPVGTQRVFGTVQTENGQGPVSTEIQVGGGSFSAGICYQDATDSCDEGHVNETVGWLALAEDRFNPYHKTDIGAVDTRDTDWESFDFGSPYGDFDFDRGFESPLSGWNTVSGTWGSSSICTANEGSNALVSTGDGEIRSETIDLSGATSKRLSYDLIQGYESDYTGGCSDLESGQTVDGGRERFYIQYLNDNSDWETVRIHRAGEDDPEPGVWDEYTFSLPDDAYHSNFRIRLVNTASTNDQDFWAMDDLEISDGSVGLVETQTRGGGQESTVGTIISNQDEGRARFCEIEDASGCDGFHAQETLAWSTFETGTIHADLYDYPSYTNDPTELYANCYNYQRKTGTGINHARFFVNGSATGIPANHRQQDEPGGDLEPYAGTNWGDGLVAVRNTSYDPTGLADGRRGSNLTVAFQCQDDEASFNYWGPYEEDWIIADTRVPLGLNSSLSEFFINEDYTNQEVHNVTLSFEGTGPSVRPDLARFSCQSDGPWTRWREYDNARVEQNFSFDLTDPFNGCSDGDGERTVYTEIRDYANNSFSIQASDTITLDRDDPTIDSLEPQNRYINLTDMLRLNASDDEAVSVGQEAPGNTFFNGTANQTFTVNSFFNPDYRYGQEKSLTYTWYDTEDYSADYAGDESEMDGFFNDNNAGVDFGGTGQHERRIYWFDSQFASGDQRPSYLPQELFAWKVEGSIYAPRDGRYTFAIDSDDASDLAIDGDVILSDYGSHSPSGDWSVQEDIVLEHGWHDLTVRMQDGGGGNGIGVAWKRPTDDSFEIIQYQDFTTPSRKALDTWVFDKASNIAFNRYNLTLDINAPVFTNVTPENDSYVAPGDSITFNASDDFQFGFLRVTDDDGPTDLVAAEDYTYSPSWTTEEQKNLTVRLNDSAGNINTGRFWYNVDDTPPVFEGISESNNSFINTTELVVNASDARSGLGTLRASNDGTNYTFTDGNEFTVDWGSDGGIQDLRLFIPDAVGNMLTKDYSYTVDLIDPTSSINISWSSRGDTVNGYVENDVAYEITASDNLGHQYIRYCVADQGQTCSMDSLSGVGADVTDVASCPDGETCELYVNWQTNDSAGNTDVPDRTISDNILIDKGIPTMTFENPGSGDTVSGFVDLRTTIDDGGASGISTVTFSVNEPGDPTSDNPLFSGELNASNNWDVTWNSSVELAGELQEVWFNVTALDNLGNRREETLTFTVDNTNIIDRIVAPDGIYVTSPFSLNATAERPGTPVLENHSYTIKDPDGSVIDQDSITGIDDDVHEFDRFIDASSWAQDGNYTLNTVAWDSEVPPVRASDEAWFYLDREAPDATISSPGNDTWQSGIIDVTATVQDDVKDGQCLWRYRTSGGQWQGNTSLSCGTGQTFQFNTQQCGDTYAPDCIVEVYAIDAAGNVASDRINLRIDNQAPSTNVTGPAAGSWQNADFDVGREDGDNVVPTDELTCEWRNDTSGWMAMSNGCDGSLEVDISQYCKQKGQDVCEIGFRVTDEVGFTDTASRTFSIDTRKPQVSSIDPDPLTGRVINGSQDITVTFTDGTSGVQFARYDNGTVNSSLTSGSAFDPGWEDDGGETLTIRLNDSADNLRTQPYEYILDVTPPNVTWAGYNVSFDSAFSEYRIYPDQPIRFETAVRDNRQVIDVTATLNTSSNPVSGENISLERINGSQSQGTWVFEYADTDQSGLYNVTRLYMEDGVVNRNMTTDLPAFRVVDYGIDVDLDGGSTINAGHQRNLTVSGTLNRTIDDPVRIYIPRSSPSANRTPYYNNTSAFDCTFGGSCDIDRSFHDDGLTYLDLNGTGSSTVELEADVRAAAPDSNTDTIWRSVVQGIVRTNTTTVLAPDMDIGTTLCNGSLTCRTNQSEPINLTVTLQNRNSSNNDGHLNSTFVNFTNATVGESVEKSFGDIIAGNTSRRNMTVNVSRAGNITFRIEAFETFTDTYTDTDTKIIHVRDTTPPEFLNLTASPEEVYVNDTVDLTVNAEDNLKVDEVNVTIDRPDGQTVNVSLNQTADGSRSWTTGFNNTTTGGTYTVTDVLVIDGYGNQNATAVSKSFEVGQIEIVDAAQTSGEVDDTVDILANVSGNITTVTGVETDIYKPRNHTESGSLEAADGASDYVFEYTNATRSGPYTINITAEADRPTGQGQIERWNVSTDLFQIDFGTPGIVALDGEGGSVELPESIDAAMTWSIVPGMGDLVDANVTLATNDTSVIDLAGGESDLHELGNITYEGGEVFTEYDITTGSSGAAELNVSVETQNGGFETDQTAVTVLPEDTEDPSITNYGETPSEVNKGQAVQIEATVEDNSVLRNLTIVVNHPENGTNYTADPETMNRLGSDTFRHTYTNTTETGHYTYRITAWDVGENNDTIISNSFDVSEDYSINISADRSIYKKSDEADITIDVENVNGDPVEEYNATVIIDRAGTNHTYAQDSFIEEFSYFIEPSYAPSPNANEGTQEYTVFVNVSKEGNEGSSTHSFDVTRLLDITAVDPQQGGFVEPGEDFEFTVEIRGPNDEVLPVLPLKYAQCNFCPSDFKSLSSTAQAGQYKTTFTAPEDEESIALVTYASDLRGNSESQAAVAPNPITVSVGNDTSPGPGTGAGGGGGGGGGFGSQFEVDRVSPETASLPSNATEVNLSVSTSLAADCRYTTESLDIIRIDAMNMFNVTGGQLHWSTVPAEQGTTYSYNIYCEEAAGENVTTEVVFSVASETIASFGLFIPDTIPADGTGIEQGTEQTTPFSVFNNGTETISVDVSSEVTDCCEAWITDGDQRLSSFDLEQGAERSLQLHVDVPLNTSLERYSADLAFESQGRARERAVRFEVIKGERIQRLEDLKNRSRQIRQTIRDYRTSGIDVSEIEQRQSELVDIIGNADQAVAQDDRTVLETQLGEGENLAGEIEGQLRALALQNYIRENWWKWLLGSIIIYTVFFLLTMVAVPYYRLQTDLIAVKNKLESATEARKKAERQYFNRQIDRDTFMDIMTDRQDEILELRSERDDLEDDMDHIFENRLTAENYLKAPLKAVREINRWVEARRTKIATEVDEEG